MTIIKLRTKKDLQEFAENFLSENYGLSLTHEIKINGRLTKTWGQVAYTHDYSNVVDISIAKRVIEYGNDLVVLDTVKHELIHYALWKLNKPFCDSDDYFQNELVKHGATGENEINYIGKLFEHTCENVNCDKVFYLNKNSVKSHICSCDAELVVTSEVVSDGHAFTTIKKY